MHQVGVSLLSNKHSQAREHVLQRNTTVHVTKCSYRKQVCFREGQSACINLCLCMFWEGDLLYYLVPWFSDSGPYCFYSSHVHVFLKNAMCAQSCSQKIKIWSWILCSWLCLMVLIPLPADTWEPHFVLGSTW